MHVWTVIIMRDLQGYFRTNRERLIVLIGSNVLRGETSRDTEDIAVDSLQTS